MEIKTLALTNETLFEQLEKFDFKNKLVKGLKPIKVHSLLLREADQLSSLFLVLKRWYPSNYFHQLHYLALKFFAIMRQISPSSLSLICYYHYFEWIQHHDPDRPNYRDHMIHVFKVAYLGHWILNQDTPLLNLVNLNQKNGRIQKFLGYYGLEKNVLDKSVLIQAWWLASLFHDFGYAFNFFCNKLEAKVRKMYPFYQSNSTDINIDFLNEIEFERSILYSYIYNKLGYNKSRTLTEAGKKREITSLINHDLKINHGAAGALLLLSSYHQLQKMAIYDPITSLIFQLAAEAICIHDLTKSKKSHLWARKECFPSFNVDEVPLGCLLILCDEIQGEGRTCLDSIEVSPTEVKWCDKQDDKKTKISYDEEKNELKIDVSDKSIVKDRNSFNIDDFVKIKIE